MNRNKKTLILSYKIYYLTNKAHCCTGTVLQFLASILIISSWIHHTHYEIKHMTPGWFIPIVGSLIIPIAGVAHGKDSTIYIK